MFEFSGMRCQPLRRALGLRLFMEIKEFSAC
ncbi:GNAT family N-acetyltransferase, partial [Vibrio cholerae]